MRRRWSLSHQLNLLPFLFYHNPSNASSIILTPKQKTKPGKRQEDITFPLTLIPAPHLPPLRHHDLNSWRTEFHTLLPTNYEAPPNPSIGCDGLTKPECKPLSISGSRPPYLNRLVEYPTPGSPWKESEDVWCPSTWDEVSAIPTCVSLFEESLIAPSSPAFNFRPGFVFVASAVVFGNAVITEPLRFP